MKFQHYAVLAIAALSCSNTQFGVVNAQTPTAAPSATASGSATSDRTGESSVVVFGRGVSALGDFSNVNGGDDNIADGDYAVIAGGKLNFADRTFSTISGGEDNFIAGRKFDPSALPPTECTISGGNSNFIVSTGEDSVITGGIGNSVCFGRDNRDTNCSGCTISGGQGITCDAIEAVRTGGVGVGNFNRVSSGDRSVATGGRDNGSGGKNAVIVGGKNNIADGTLSIALGTQVQANTESSMVINLNPDGKKSLKSKKAGQFIANAESYSFQIGQNNDDLSIQITEDNIQNLIDALENAAAS
ncbi:hypothetical protein FRACYDRAFT_235401 [Fragilariopsis cylindrus CCMP1102]|uniref:Uncharacterized protein n=1 Tax=Fragilariopsis cylindrus CCMP1102 TaxID=635003 RepID=A0A1E7FMK0_9STRA|nr:hypothetical protein FRACYDRAFT_235401 [Fragilariopsis cylindrus CCMP1102]|eukprot:OEU19354.1 hypothetical protein FRACYDRAFT_235401 [Fragilariopsis cylindrus CCMP1102]